MYETISVFYVNGDIAEYGASVQEALRLDFAALAGAAAERVFVSVEPASVRISFTIAAESVAESEAYMGLLSSKLGTAELAAAQLGAPIIATPAFEVAVRRVFSPAPPQPAAPSPTLLFPPTPSTPPIVLSSSSAALSGAGGESMGMTVGIAVGVVLALLLVVAALWVCRRGKRRSRSRYRARSYDSEEGTSASRTCKQPSPPGSSAVGYTYSRPEGPSNDGGFTSLRTMGVVGGSSPVLRRLHMDEYEGASPLNKSRGRPMGIVEASMPLQI